VPRKGRPLCRFGRRKGRDFACHELSLALEARGFRIHLALFPLGLLLSLRKSLEPILRALDGRLLDGHRTVGCETRFLCSLQSLVGGAQLEARRLEFTLAIGRLGTHRIANTRDPIDFG